MVLNCSACVLGFCVAGSSEAGLRGHMRALRAPSRRHAANDVWRRRSGASRRKSRPVGLESTLSMFDERFRGCGSSRRVPQGCVSGSMSASGLLQSSRCESSASSMTPRRPLVPGVTCWVGGPYSVGSRALSSRNLQGGERPASTCSSNDGQSASVRTQGGRSATQRVCRDVVVYRG
jgi:hypothetical protein